MKLSEVVGKRFSNELIPYMSNGKQTFTSIESMLNYLHLTGLDDKSISIILESQLFEIEEDTEKKLSIITNDAAVYDDSKVAKRFAEQFEKGKIDSASIVTLNALIQGDTTFDLQTTDKIGKDIKTSCFDNEDMECFKENK